MACELCGKEALLYRAVVEGTSMNVCKECGRFGKILSQPPAPKKNLHIMKEEPVFDVVEDFAEKIKKTREMSGLTQKEFAMSINEKESLVAKLETGELRPSIPLAQKLEKLLKIKLIIEELEGTVEKAGKTDTLTIGDIIKTKK